MNRYTLCLFRTNEEVCTHIINQTSKCVVLSSGLVHFDQQYSSVDSYRGYQLTGTKKEIRITVGGVSSLLLTNELF